jgi:hypothetical protein
MLRSSVFSFNTGRFIGALACFDLFFFFELDANVAACSSASAKASRSKSSSLISGLLFLSICSSGTLVEEGPVA